MKGVKRAKGVKGAKSAKGKREQRMQTRFLGSHHLWAQKVWLQDRVLRFPTTWKGSEGNKLGKEDKNDICSPLPHSLPFAPFVPMSPLTLSLPDIYICVAIELSVWVFIWLGRCQLSTYLFSYLSSFLAVYLYCQLYHRAWHNTGKHSCFENICYRVNINVMVQEFNPDARTWRWSAVVL